MKKIFTSVFLALFISSTSYGMTLVELQIVPSLGALCLQGAQLTDGQSQLLAQFGLTCASAGGGGNDCPQRSTSSATDCDCCDKLSAKLDEVNRKAANPSCSDRSTTGNSRGGDGKSAPKAN